MSTHEKQVLCESIKNLSIEDLEGVFKIVLKDNLESEK